MYNLYMYLCINYNLFIKLFTIPVFLGYANEVGEAFRSLVHVNLVRLSYGVATSYVIADAIHKGVEANEVLTAENNTGPVLFIMCHHTLPIQ